MGLGGGRGVFSVYRVLLTVKCYGHPWVIWCVSNFRRAYISKMAGPRAKRSEIWGSGPMSIQCTCIQGTFDSKVLNVIPGSFGAFPIISNLVSRKRQVLGRHVHLNLYVIQFYVVFVCHLVKQIVKVPGLLVLPSHEDCP